MNKVVVWCGVAIGVVGYLVIWCGVARGDDPEYSVTDVSVFFVEFDQDTYKFEVTATVHEEGAGTHSFVAQATITESGYQYSPMQGSQYADHVWKRAAMYGVDLFYDREVRCWAGEIRSMIYPPGLSDPYSKQGYLELKDWVEDEQDPIDPDADPLEFEACPDCQIDDAYADQSSGPYSLDDVFDGEDTGAELNTEFEKVFDALELPTEIGDAGYSFTLPIAIPGVGVSHMQLSSDPSDWSQLTLKGAGAAVQTHVRAFISIMWVFWFVMKIIREVRNF